ncbi:putative ATP-grasp-modified RiPP [Streptomyces sp. NPDC001985]|uniref:putative ATP-grasp-modified RiPP n=1 Tax=Streptomyces sp. NPDC001985 TaxID=3154406 RepID=UPI0033192BA2
MSTLAPPVLSGSAQHTGPATAGRVRPFGLTTALRVPVSLEKVPGKGGLSLCPVRQITVDGTGEPFIHAPSMGSEIWSRSQTREDMQLTTDTAKDTD